MTAGTQLAGEAAEPPLRERILSAAFAAFMERGYAGTSTLDIASRAHVSKRDIYSNFRSKQAMLAACITARAERMRLPLQLPAPQTHGALVTALTCFGATLLREASRPEVLAVYRLAIAEADRSPDIAETLDRLGRAKTREALARMLRAAQETGLLGRGNPREMADVFTTILWRGGLLTRLLLRLTPSPSATECERLAGAATEVLLRLYPSNGA